MITRIAALILFITLHVNAEIIRIPHNHLRVVISHNKKPFSIAGQQFINSKEASALLAFIYQNWKLDKRPVLIVTHNTKASMPDEHLLHAEISILSRKFKIRVIYMPIPISYRLNSSLEIKKLSKQWAKQESKVKDIKNNKPN